METQDSRDLAIKIFDLPTLSHGVLNAVARVETRPTASRVTCSAFPSFSVRSSFSVLVLSTILLHQFASPIHQCFLHYETMSPTAHSDGLTEQLWVRDKLDFKGYNASLDGQLEFRTNAPMKLYSTDNGESRRHEATGRESCPCILGPSHSFLILILFFIFITPLALFSFTSY